jgi:hypothetical protein
MYHEKPFSTREENPAKSFAIIFKRKTKKDLAHKRVFNFNFKTAISLNISAGSTGIKSVSL